MSCSCGSSQQRIQLALAVQCVNPVAVADMASVDEDLRHGPASVRPFGHLAPPRRIGIHVDLLEGDALRFEQALRPMAIRAEHARVDFDPGHPESLSKIRYSQIYGALTTRSTRRRDRKSTRLNSSH